METTIPRRQFLASAVGTLAGLSLVEPPTADAQFIEALIEALIWLGEHILAPVAVAYFTDQIRNAPVVHASNDGSFHDSFNSSVALDTSLTPQPDRWNGYVGLNRGLPSMCNSTNVSKVGELNLPEIRALQDDRNPDLYYGGQLRLAPIPSAMRSYPAPADLRFVGNYLDYNRMNPAAYRVRYARSFCDCSGVRLRGFHLTDTRTGHSGFRIFQV